MPLSATGCWRPPPRSEGRRRLEGRPVAVGPLPSRPAPSSDKGTGTTRRGLRDKAGAARFSFPRKAIALGSHPHGGGHVCARHHGEAAPCRPSSARLIPLLVGVPPRRGCSSGWGYGGIVGGQVIVVIVLALTGRLSRRETASLKHAWPGHARPWQRKGRPGRPGCP
ncbi:DUF3309 family protein [Xanthobacter autotrophicus DSM 431]|uniref:DUF3309 family protein n=1 Tax=Xanthobacter nonsaccharivorans TaxID=3119912 RepID=UPI00372C3FE0